MWFISIELENKSNTAGWFDNHLSYRCECAQAEGITSTIMELKVFPRVQFQDHSL